VYVVGGTESQLISLRESLSETSLSFQSWSGTVAPAGVVRLDKRLPLSGLISHVKWSFTYDKDRAPHFQITTGSRVVEGLSQIRLLFIPMKHGEKIMEFRTQ
jgi:hypothetical protein